MGLRDDRLSNRAETTVGYALLVYGAFSVYVTIGSANLDPSRSPPPPPPAAGGATAAVGVASSATSRPGVSSFYDFRLLFRLV